MNPKGFISPEEEVFMIIVLKPGCGKKSLSMLIKKVEELGFKAHTIVGVERTVVGAVGDDRDKHLLYSLEALPCVEKLVPILQPYKLASREFKREATMVKVGDAPAVSKAEGMDKLARLKAMLK